MMIGIIIYLVCTWSSIQVLACKNKDDGATAPPPPACTEGDILNDSDYVINQINKTKEDAKQVVPSTVYVEVMVAIDDDLYSKIGKSYKNGKWSSESINKHSDAEVYLYARKFMSAVNIKFQSQFENPKIKFILRKAFKIRTYIFSETKTKLKMD